MTPRIAGFAILPLALALTACGPREPHTVRLDSGLAGLVPHDSVLLAGVNMDAVRETPVYRKTVLENHAARLDEFTRETGLDPRRDISELLAASDGKHTLLLAKGRFSAAAFEARKKGAGGSIPYKNHEFLGSEEAAVVLLESTLAAAGPASALRSLIDRRHGSRSARPALLEMVNEVPPGSQIWMVSRGLSPAVRDAIPDEGNLGNLRRIVEPMDTLILGLDLRSNLRLEAKGACRTEQDAKVIHDGLRGLLGIARLMTPDTEPDLLRLFDSIAVEQRETTVRFTAEVPLDVLDRVLQKAGKSP